jgi:hypothetical protein
MSEFDWVEKRFHCSLGEVFENLRAEVDGDVRKRQELLDPSERSFWTFNFRSSDRSFTAWVRSRDTDVHKTVEFRLEATHISIRRPEPAKIILASVTLNNEGRCILKIVDEEYERWQLRKLALEDLFFNFV